MRKAFANSALSIFGAMVLSMDHQQVSARSSWSGYVNSSPFVGEHRDARTIEHGNGRVTSKMHPVKNAYNKYESFIQRDGLFKNRKAKSV